MEICPRLDMIILQRSGFFLFLCVLEYKLGVEMWVRHFKVAYHFFRIVSIPVPFTFQLLNTAHWGSCVSRSLNRVGFKHFLLIVCYNFVLVALKNFLTLKHLWNVIMLIHIPRPYTVPGQLLMINK